MKELGIFLQPYKDELLYSLFSRYHIRKGHLSLVNTAEDLFENQRRQAEIEFFDKLTEEAYYHLTKNRSMEEVIMEHTMYKQYAKFLSLEKRKCALEDLVQMKGRYTESLAMPWYTNENKRYLRYCPLCVEADRKKFGEAYWHTIHQLRGINICCLHHCRLYNGNVVLGRKCQLNFVPLENQELNMNVELCKDETEIKLTDYVYSVFQQPISFDNDVSITDFMNSKLEYTKYISTSGNMKKLQLLCDDFFEYYKTIKDNPYGLINREQIDSIFLGHRFNMYEICKLGMLVGVEEDEFIDLKLPEISQQQQFTEDVLRLKKQGLGNYLIAKMLNTNATLVKNTCIRNGY